MTPIQLLALVANWISVELVKITARLEKVANGGASVREGASRAVKQSVVTEVELEKHAQRVHVRGE